MSEKSNLTDGKLRGMRNFANSEAFNTFLVQGCPIIAKIGKLCILEALRLYLNGGVGRTFSDPCRDLIGFKCSSWLILSELIGFLFYFYILCFI